MLNQDDLRAYLSVLGYPPAGVQADKIVGCLIRIEEQLEQLAHGDKEIRVTYDLLKFRERLNGYVPHDHPILFVTTRQLAGRLSDHLKYEESS